MRIANPYLTKVLHHRLYIYRVGDFRPINYLTYFLRVLEDLNRKFLMSASLFPLFLSHMPFDVINVIFPTHPFTFQRMEISLKLAPPKATLIGLTDIK